MSNETVTLNIGLNNNPIMRGMSARDIANRMQEEIARHASAYAAFPGAHVAAIIVRDDENSAVTEPTAVVSYYARNLDRAKLEDALDAFAATLEQEAIAAWVDSETASSYGFLVGPKAEAWGPFDELKFELGSFNLSSWTTSTEPVRVLK